MNMSMIPRSQVLLGNEYKSQSYQLNYNKKINSDIHSQAKHGSER